MTDGMFSGKRKRKVDCSHLLQVTGEYRFVCVGACVSTCQRLNGVLLMSLSLCALLRQGLFWKWPTVYFTGSSSYRVLES